LGGLVAKKKVEKNTWGLVRMDGTSKLQWKLKEKKETNPRFWRSDWRK
jgi:hypothetical protein